jgi:hypothetical protein
MISRRRFLKSSSEAGIAITTARVGLGAMLVDAVESAANEPGRSVSEQRPAAVIRNSL